MAVVEKILKCHQKFLVEVLYTRILVDVQIQEVAECVVISLESEYCETFLESLQHLLRIHVRWR
jgi:hypothetical protein